jgi:bifunctional non-homologous end joining protein LigD
LSLVRCPQGRAKKCFFQKHNTGSFGPHVHQIEIEEKKGEIEDYVYLVDQAGLMACVQMGTIEFHGWGSSVADIEKPDRLVFDLDPDEGLDFEEVKRAARDLKRYLADMGLQTFPLLTGGKGLHVVVPIAPVTPWRDAKAFAKNVSAEMAADAPDLYLTRISKAERAGRLFIDYLRNDPTSTAVAPYSTRSRPGAPVAMPVEWADVAEGLDPCEFTIRTVPERITLIRDPWREIFETEQRLPANPG